ncbi:MAG: tetratricopeptide repeat protein [Deltaproteobacteria bacterium]|nr:tetratricopeptide repeat protein [Deltaproteobacteria bacterium]
MGKNDLKGEDDRPRTIEQFLRERERIDSILQKEFKKETTILFTDICDYTSYTEKMGDLSSRAMLQKHNDIVLPVVSTYEGVVIKTIGDAVMATFPNSLAAVKAASDIQKGLHQHNRIAGTGDRIHVKVGINTGEALVDGGDVFGDAVNLAARIQSKAGKDEILVSKRVYDDVCGSDDVLCRIHEKVQVKGKTEPVQLYRVVWKDEDVAPETEPKVRAGGGVTHREAIRPLEVLYLEVAREGDRIKLCAYEQKPGETSTIQHYEETDVSMDRVKTRCHEMVETLNKVNRRGLVSRENLKRLREIGQVFSDELFTLNVKEKLKNSKADHMILNLDDQLVHVPWELLYDGQQFLCQRFSMGRLVKTRQPVGARRSRVLARPLKMLVLADPGGDLEGAYTEGTRIRDTMDSKKDFVNATLRSGNITPDFIKKKIRNFDVVHFAGHSDYDPQRPGESGWRLTGGNLKTEDIARMTGASAMPALIFSNACQSGRTEEWGLRESFQEEIFGLANVFLLAGVKHFVGTFWEIMDEPSSRFAMEFYQCFMSGMTMGEAVREARHALIREYGEENIVWASYLLYGDPTSNYMDQIMAAEPRKEPRPSVTVLQKGQVLGEVRSREEPFDFSKREPTKRKWPWMALAAGVLLLSSFVLWGYPGLLRKGTGAYEEAALAYYHQGAFDEALSACTSIEARDPHLSLAYLIRGDVYFRRGDLDAAKAAYQKAIAAKKGAGVQKAGAYIGLGRIASIRKETDKALGYYESAARVAPESGVAYLSQAVLFEDKGEYGKALELLEKARTHAPQDQALVALTNETRKKADLAINEERQARIDRMVQELVETMKSPPAPVPSDGWTSTPLTLWVMDVETDGYSLQEGEEKLLVAGIQDQLLQHCRARLVERGLLDKLLAELKLGTSQLVDKQTALSLGRILAARLILTGQVVYSGPQTQVSMRLIETETGRITAAVNETFGSAVPVSIVSEEVSKKVMEKVNENYPLRGKISTVEGNEVTLNIGQMAGTRKGQKYNVIDQDADLEVISDQLETATAKIVKGNTSLVEGMRVEASNGAPKD